uniref:Putative secreted protein n=1 Tax=Anopheles darlingi TaxID=43151 RepID=A0A2M4DHD5_ANODA
MVPLRPIKPAQSHRRLVWLVVSMVHRAVGRKVGRELDGMSTPATIIMRPALSGTLRQRTRTNIITRRAGWVPVTATQRTPDATASSSSSSSSIQLNSSNSRVRHITAHTQEAMDCTIRTVCKRHRCTSSRRSRPLPERYIRAMNRIRISCVTSTHRVVPDRPPTPISCTTNDLNATMVAIPPMEAHTLRQELQGRAPLLLLPPLGVLQLPTIPR